MKLNFNSSYLRYLIFGLLISVVIVILSVLSLGIVDQVTRAEKRERFSKPHDIITFFFNNTNEENQIKLIKRMSQSRRSNFPFDLLLSDRDGNLIAPESSALRKIDLKKFPTLKSFQSEPPHHRKRGHKRPDPRDERPSEKREKGERGKLKRALKPLIGGPPERGPHPNRLILNFKYKLKNSDNFLVFKAKKNHSKQDNKKRFLVSMLTLTGVLVLGIACTILFMLFSFRKRTAAIDTVIEKLKKGNLKARIAVGKIDEYSQTVLRFNDMAEEIENLVNSLRITEDSRKNLMRELAHDLRTPIASLKNCIEILKTKSHLLDEDKKTQLLDISIKETAYFSLLVDDLLFLGQVNEPRYKTDYNEIIFDELIQTEVQNLRDRYQDINILFTGNMKDKVFNGDRKLLTRMIRNGLENACSFAKSEVCIKTNINNLNEIEILISDDGAGFKEEALKDFGQKKYSRAISQKGENGRISIGLGSVIMKSVASSHRGSLRASNIVEGNKIKGALVLITLPNV